jgi:hypothetical protein
LEEEEDAIVAGVGYIYVVMHPFNKGLQNLCQQEKLKLRTKSSAAATAVAKTW